MMQEIQILESQFKVQAQSANNPTTSQQAAASIDAMVLSRLAVSSSNVPVSGGLCVPRGQLFDITGLQVKGFDQPVYGQSEVLNRWSDGSVRWVLVSFVAPKVQAATADSSGVNDAKAESSGLPLTILACADDDAADTLTTVKCQDSQIVLSFRCEHESLPSERTLRLKTLVTDSSGQLLPIHVDRVLEEVQGSVRRVFSIYGRLKSHPYVTILVRITHWVQANQVQVDSRIRNSRRARHAGGLWDLGDAGSFFFSDLSLQITSDETGTSAKTWWKAEQDQSWRQCAAENQIRILQSGSGGRFWSSANHVNAHAESVVENRGYTAAGVDGVLRGYRSEPAVGIVSDDGAFVVAVPEFWQQFPGSVSANQGCVTVGLFPEGGQRSAYELQGGEQKTQSVWIEWMEGQPNGETLQHVFQRPLLLQSPETYRSADCLPWFPGTMIDVTVSEASRSEASRSEASRSEASRSEASRRRGLMPLDDDITRLGRYLNDAISGNQSLSARRDKIDEYGWRNFGDIHADHEQTHFEGSKTVVSHYNNQFDLIFGGILQLAATSDLRWFDLFDPMARHVMDIDIYHTDEDRAVFNGGLFWHTDHYVDAGTATHRTYSRHNQKPGRPYGGGPGCEHNYTTGLLHYYFLTGHPEAREAVLSLAEWVIQMDDGRNTIFGLLDDGATGHASATVFEDFHGPGRGAGNSVNALLDAWILTRSDRFLQKAEELICRCVHPKQDLAALHLADAEGHWSYTVFLTSLGRYLLAKLEAEQRDEMYSYARETMRHYGRWMAAHEKPTLSIPEDLQYPTEAWAAQDFRKANVLRLAAACEDDARQAAIMRSRARDLNNAAWSDLYSFNDAHLTARCLSILMTEGQRDFFHRTCPSQVVPAGTVDWKSNSVLAEPWVMFVPQKERVRRLLKSPSHLMKVAVRMIDPRRCVRAIKALKRQIS